MTRPFAPGLPAPSPIGLGTAASRIARAAWRIGSWIPTSELGGTLIDTAARYGFGESEQVIGEWLRASGARDSVIAPDQGCAPRRVMDQPTRCRLDRRRPGREPGAISASTRSTCCWSTGTTRACPSSPSWIRSRRWWPAAARGRSVSPTGPPRRLTAGHGVRGEHRRCPHRGQQRLSRAGRAAPAHGPTAASMPATTRRSPGMRRTTCPCWPGRPSRRATSSPAGTRPTAPQAVVDAYDTPGNRARRERARQLGRGSVRRATQVAIAWVLAQACRPVALGGFRDVAGLRDAWAAASIDLSVEQCHWLETGDTLD